MLKGNYEKGNYYKAFKSIILKRIISPWEAKRMKVNAVESLQNWQHTDNGHHEEGFIICCYAR